MTGDQAFEVGEVLNFSEIAISPENYTPMILSYNHNPVATLKADGTLQIDWEAVEQAASGENALFDQVGILATLMIAVRDKKYVSVGN